ncbi:MAG: MopE-related protein [Candidatus Nealsonbacteria bacterium]
MAEEKSNNKYISLQEATKYCEYSQKYLSLRGRQGKLKAVKIGRNWLTKKEWVKEYVERMEEYNNNFRVKKVVPPPKNLPVEEIARVRPVQLRPALAIVLAFVLLIAGGVLGKTSFQNVSGTIDNTFSTIAQKILKPGQELAAISSPDVLKSTLNTFKEYGQWVNESVKNQTSNLKSGYLAFNYFIEEKLDNASRAVLSGVKGFTQRIREIPKIVSQPFKKVVIKKEVPLSEAVVEKAKREIIEAFQKEFKELKEEGLPVREIIKEIEVSRITKIEPIKEITKEIKTLDDESLKKIRTILSQQETKVEKLKLAARLSYVIFPDFLPPKGGTTVSVLGTIGAGTWQAESIEDAYVVDDLTIASTKAGSFSFSGTSPALTVSQSGAGLAALIDNLQMKTGTIEATAGDLILDSNSGNVKIVLGDAAGAKQFQIADSTGAVVAYVDSVGNLDASGRATFSKAPTLDHTGTWLIGSSTWNQANATIYINPASAATDSNLIGVAVAGSVIFSLDAEGDIFARNLILTGSTTTGTTTTGDLSVEGSTTLGDSTGDTLILNPATLTWAGGNKVIDITGAATRTLTLLNSTASQVADLDLSDGSLKTAGTSRLTNTGALENIIGYSQSSGDFAVSGSGTFSTATGAISLNGDVTIAANKNLTLSSGTGVISQTFSGTTQTPHTLTATFAPTAGGTQNALNLAITNNPSTSANTLRGLNLSFTDSGTLANTIVGLNVDVTTANVNDTTYAAIFQEGNVGIGTTSPDALLTVGSGDLFQVNSSGNITFNQTAPTITFGDTGTLTIKDSSNNTLLSLADSDAFATLTINTISPTTINAFTLGGAITGDSQNITNLGQLTVDSLQLDGTTIGLTTDTDLLSLADNQLTVNGTLALGSNNITMTGSLAADGARVLKGWFTDIESTNMPTVGGTSLSTTFVDVAGDTMGGDLNMGGNIIYGSTADNGDLILRTTTSATKTTSYLILADDGGNVGIGDASPSYKLDVAGDINFTGALREDGVEILSGMISAFTGACPTGWTEYTAARGRTIVGTPSGGTNEGTVGTALTNLGTRTITDVSSHYHSVNPPNTSTNTTGAHTHTYQAVAVTSVTGKYAGDYGTHIATLPTYNTGSAGNHSHTVNIAPFNSASSGVASVDVTMPYIQLTYCKKNAGADLAEWIPASEDISAETIVSVDPNNREKIIASRKPYDPAIIGIISTQPGWLIGEENSDSVQMALAGRVPTRVSLMNGEIKPGDPITTSPIPGVGMRATKSGPIVGKAMESLNETSSLINCSNPETGIEEKCGTILVFVNISWFIPGNNEYQEDTILAQASNDYYELLRFGQDLDEGDLVSLTYDQAPNEKNPSQQETVTYIYKTSEHSLTSFVGVISNEINGKGDLLRRERVNNKIISEIRLISSGIAKVKISPLSEEIKPGDFLTSSDELGKAEKATKAGPTIARALESWTPDSGKETIRALIGFGWWDPDVYLTDSGNLNVMNSDQDTELGIEDQESGILGDFIQKVKQALASLGLFIENGIAKVKELIAEKITAKKFCLEGDNGEIICVDKNQLEELLMKNQIQNININNNSDSSGGSVGSIDGSNNDLGETGETPPDCDTTHLNLCTTQAECETAAGFWYNEGCNVETLNQEQSSGTGQAEAPACQPTEEVCDGLDDDCDELIDEDLGQTTCGIGACAVTIDNCIGGQSQTCTPGTPTDEICDQIDNNCDGQIDEGSVCVKPEVPTE